MPEISDREQRAILSVVDVLVGRAGRTTLVMALRGSRAKRALQFGVEQTTGYGFFAGHPEAEVLARVDDLIATGILALERSSDGFPLLCYTRRGLERAERYVAEEWLAIVRRQVAAVATGARLDLPFVHSAMPQRNLDTVRQLIDLVAQEATDSWRPLLEAWAAADTKRVRGWIQQVIAGLGGSPRPPSPAS
ncbi:RQC domain-containing protein [Opitutus sp. ER46]|uniref:RQC domain-containing protein n=1 Tax=Opitutus sp. ER46 TaxID=2161864 RepID=UPI001304A22D|nr:RQC domain-containing protein [Opitutus sp. ER46]